jgi:hypothetical protein
MSRLPWAQQMMVVGGVEPAFRCCAVAERGAYQHQRGASDPRLLHFAPDVADCPTVVAYRVSWPDDDGRRVLRLPNSRAATAWARARFCVFQPDPLFFSRAFAVAGRDIRGSIRRPAAHRRRTRTRPFAQCPVRSNEHQLRTPGRCRNLAGARSCGFALSPLARVARNLSGLNFSFVKISTQPKGTRSRPAKLYPFTPMWRVTPYSQYIESKAAAK